MKKRDMIFFALAAIGAYFLFFRRTPAPPPVQGAVSPVELRRISTRYEK